ncbi:MAG: tetratricopeptide repeat protein, partial [Burkholderiales bacterium]|nr:tetratricopeptide repeat protein [Burkholderiales bacterium]
EFTYALGDVGEARAYYQRVLEQGDSQYAPFAQYGLAWTYLKEQQAQPAADAFDALLREHPQHQLREDALVGRGIALRQSGQYQRA